jgi:putative transposase
MSYNEGERPRRSIRLPDYDYTSPGAYFITICTHRRDLLFGEAADGDVVLNQYGQIAREEWQASEQIRREIELDIFVIMPNHLHGIVWIRETNETPTVRAHGRAPVPQRPLLRLPRSLGSFVAGYKSVVTARVNQMRGTPGASVWQRNYYEHVIRNDASLEKIREYIQHNPARWCDDRLHPNARRDRRAQR